MEAREALRIAHRRWGYKGFAWIKSVQGTRMYHVGTYHKGSYSIYGVGVSFEAAFEAADARKDSEP